MGMLLGISLCVDDIDKSKAVKHTNGKTYYSFTVSVNDTVNKWGKDVSLWHQQEKDEREAKMARTFVGGGSTLYSTVSSVAKEKPTFGEDGTFGGGQQGQSGQQEQSGLPLPPLDDDLPF